MRDSKEPAGAAPAQCDLLHEAAAIQNIYAISNLERKAIEGRSAAEQMADRVTRGAGSAPFLVFHVVWFSIWISMNAGMVPGVTPFDPFPFSFLTLVTSIRLKQFF